MSNSKDAIDRLFKLQTKINMMVMDGTREAKNVADILQQILEERQTYLRHVETSTLAPTKGDVTLAEANNVFSWLDGDFKNWGTDVPSEDTVKAEVDVYEMECDRNYGTLFGLLGDPRKLCLTQGQIVEFCRSHRDSLRQEGYGTFFLFKVKDVLFVANVSVVGGRLEANVYRFDDDAVWHAGSRHRLVVQQQTI